jgi:hypothetical protein
MALKTKPQHPLFTFAFHEKNWLRRIAAVAKEEPWGDDRFKILEIYLKANFEIAMNQDRVYEDEKIAFWKTGYLVNTAADSIWLIYKPNNREGSQRWVFDDVITGDCPIADHKISDFQVKYEIPEFESDWRIYISQDSIIHIINDNRRRLQEILGDLVDNTHLLFRAIYGEIELAKKAHTVIPQWYHGDYQLLMPLHITKPEVELMATLTPTPAQRRYDIKTLLPPHYAYAHARALVKNREATNWLTSVPVELLNRPIDESEDFE